jgi:hypothetical protein
MRTGQTFTWRGFTPPRRLFPANTNRDPGGMPCVARGVTALSPAPSPCPTGEGSSIASILMLGIVAGGLLFACCVCLTALAWASACHMGFR